MKDEIQLADALMSILESLDDGCLLLNRDGKILVANQNARLLLNLPKSFRQLRFEDIVQDSRLLSLLHRAEQRGCPTEQEVVVSLRINGRSEERCLTVNAAPLQLRKAGRQLMRMLLRDTTERRALERVSSEFVTNASHELRTPLSIINGYLENLLEGVVHDVPATRRCLETMRKHGERIAKIVEDMLTLARLDAAVAAGTTRLRRAGLQLSQCLSDVIERKHSLLESKQAKIVTDIATDADTIAGDRYYWDQIFANLIEYTLNGNAEGVTISFSARRSGHGITVEIADDGVGIPAEDLPFIFGRFFRGAHGDAPSIRATGLGLSIVRRAVEAHGGSISAASDPGVKTAFLIHLPDMKSLEADPEAPEIDTDPDQQGRLVLTAAK